MTKYILRPLLLSNYSLAVAITGWKSEKIFPRAILTTSLQFYFLLSTVIILSHSKVKTLEEFEFLAGELVGVGIIMMVFFRPFATWLYVKLNVLSRYKSNSSGNPGLVSGVVFTGITFVFWIGAIVSEIYISIN